MTTAAPKKVTPKPEVNPLFKSDFDAEYALARRIGDRRFGSECSHAHTKNGHCLDCQRKVR